MSQLSVDDLMALRSHLAALSEPSRREFLRTCIDHGTETFTTHPRATFRASLVIPGAAHRNPAFLCSRALSLATCSGHTRIEQLVKHHRHGEEQTLSGHAQQPQRETSDHVVQALSYLKHYIDTNAEMVPTTGKRKLRQSLSWEQLYNEYCSDPHTMEYFDIHTDSQPVSKSTFLRLYRSHFSDVVATRRTPLGKCDSCFTLHEKLRLRSLALAERQYLQQQLQDHLDLASAERLEYHTARSAASPLSGVLSIILDGARTIGFPCLLPTPKMFASTERVQLPMFGILCHTFNERRLIFSPPSSAHGSNFVVTALALFLCQLIEKHGSTLPRHELRLQCDNASENKCCYVMAFAGFLVSKGLFDTVTITMLPPGHTHEDIDGIFGAFSHTLCSLFSECYTLDDLRSVAGANTKISFRPEQFEYLDRIVDWKTYLTSVGGYRLTNITFFHLFKIGKARNGQIQMIYKEWGTFGSWRGSLEDSSGVALFPIDGLASRSDPPTISLVSPDPKIGDNIRHLTQALATHMAANPSTSARILWFDSLLSGQISSERLLANAERIFSGIPLPTEEEQLSEMPQYSSSRCANRVIVPQLLRAATPHRLLPDPFQDRTLSVSDLVIVAKNPDDDKAFPDDEFWVAEVCEPIKPSGKEPRVRILWYARSGRSYQRLPPVAKNMCDILLSTVLFSGFKLTASGHLKQDFEKMVQAELKRK